MLYKWLFKRDKVIFDDTKCLFFKEPYGNALINYFNLEFDNALS